MNATVQVIIPFRDRGIDPRRAANLEVVQAWWYAHGFDPHIVDDGLSGDAQFNRHRAYNRAVIEHPGDVYVFTEADMLIHPDQIMFGVQRAWYTRGLVVPFTQYRYMSDSNTAYIRDMYHSLYPEALALFFSGPVEPAQSGTGSVFSLVPASTMDNGRSIGAVNIVSADTLDCTGGFTEATRGNWYDDRIIEDGFAFLTGSPTRFVTGPAVHLYHLPGWTGDHLTDEDRRATAHNKELLRTMRRDIRMMRSTRVRQLMAYRAN